jgi:hypothetical protein
MDSYGGAHFSPGSYGHGGGQEAIAAMVVMFVVLLIVIPLLVLQIIAWWKICTKAGYSGWLSLLMLVPVANLVWFLILAFGDWPVLKEMRELRRLIPVAPPRAS